MNKMMNKTHKYLRFNILNIFKNIHDKYINIHENKI